MSYIVITSLEAVDDVVIVKDGGATFQTITAEDTYEGFIDDEVYAQILADLNYFKGESSITCVYTEHIPLSRDPTVNDDSADFIKVGDRWFNTSTNRSWYCEDNSSGAAVWVTRGDLYKGASSPDGSVSGNFGDMYFETGQSRFFICISDPTGTVWERIAYVS